MIPPKKKKQKKVTEKKIISISNYNLTGFFFLLFIFKLKAV